MKKVCTLLQIELLTAVAMSLLMAVVFETSLLPVGTMAGRQHAEMLLLFLMEPLTLASIFGALYMFRIGRVSTDLKSRKADALSLWGTIRIALLGLPLMVNTLLYYLFLNTSFGYLAIMLALAMCFVYPNLSRCIADTEEK
ncbi:MAG: hypothetical protein IJP74_07125 [Prevotella sp.]|nr:hypothetical protein [Prevotella sp.]